MARRKNPEPIITQTEILARAGRGIQAEIIKLRRECEEIAVKLTDVGREKDADYLRENTKHQTDYLVEKLRAIETMFTIETGEYLALLDELT